MNYNILIYNPDYIDQYIELIPKFKELNKGNINVIICENEEDLRSYILEADVLFVNSNFQKVSNMFQQNPKKIQQKK